jgi:hypothetical protein
MRRNTAAVAPSRTIGSAPSAGPQAVDPSSEYVDAVQALEPITEGQRRSRCG